MTAFLRLEGLTRRFGDRVAVDGLTLEIARGETFGFLGPNGAGKTTTFHLLTGLLAPDAGRVLIDGQPAPPTDARVRRRFGVVFQEPSLDGDFRRFRDHMPADDYFRKPNPQRTAPPLGPKGEPLL